MHSGTYKFDADGNFSMESMTVIVLTQSFDPKQELVIICATMANVSNRYESLWVNYPPTMTANSFHFS